MAVEQRSIVIVGGGLAGAYAAVVLAKRGYRVSVYERRADSRLESTIWEGRSINLALSERGRYALRRIGIEDLIVSQCVPMLGRVMHEIDHPIGTKLPFQPYGAHGESNLSMGRQMLNEALMNCAEQLNDVAHKPQFFFEHTLRSFDIHTNTLVFEHASNQITVTADIVLGADGAFSRIRPALTAQKQVNFSQSYLDHAYKELCIPAGVDSKGEATYKLNPPNALHIWPRGEFMMIALPNPDKSYTVTLFMPLESKNGLVGFNDITTQAQVEDFFKQTFPDSFALFDGQLSQQFFSNPTGNLVNMKVYPWHWISHQGQRPVYSVIVGDAAHAIVPFYGQGMNASLEDITELDRLLDEHATPQGLDDWDATLPEFSKIRKPNTDAISDLSHANYHEMRSHVQSQAFLVRTAFDRFIHRWVGDKWLPLYQMVAFTRIPYAEVVKRRDRQDSVWESALKLTKYIGGVGAVVATATLLARTSFYSDLRSRL